MAAGELHTSASSNSLTQSSHIFPHGGLYHCYLTHLCSVLIIVISLIRVGGGRRALSSAHAVFNSSQLSRHTFLFPCELARAVLAICPSSRAVSSYFPRVVLVDSAAPPRGHNLNPLSATVPDHILPSPNYHTHHSTSRHTSHCPAEATTLLQAHTHDTPHTTAHQITPTLHSKVYHTTLHTTGPHHIPPHHTTLSHTTLYLGMQFKGQSEHIKKRK